MLSKRAIKDIYVEIRKYLFYMIPERWESIYLYASVIQQKNIETGEMYFYYFPKGMLKKNPINVYEIPSKFNIDEGSYMKLAGELYNLIKELRRQCIEYDRTSWSNITISIEDVDFLAEYNCDDLLKSMYGSEDRRKIWEYKYLDYSIDRYSKDDKKMINSYIEEEEKGLHGVSIYSETFYQEHIHNSIQYDIEKKEEREIYITEDHDYESQKDINKTNIKNSILNKDKTTMFETPTEKLEKKIEKLSKNRKFGEYKKIDFKNLEEEKVDEYVPIFNKEQTYINKRNKNKNNKNDIIKKENRAFYLNKRTNNKEIKTQNNKFKEDTQDIQEKTIIKNQILGNIK